MAFAGTLEGHYDGFCDGFLLTTLSNGSASGVETGCISGPIAGAKGKFKGAVVNENHLNFEHVYLINKRDHTWAIYLPDGSILQSGTWTPGPAGANTSNLPRTGTK